ncbi:MAG: 3-methyl-2-oxobutanoate dehydrogenase subunit beta, partial [Candidatus Omnitrophica bacterium]|nr:3-methyl-2-oxobutanoate dehydrogenase subunit beta [Candidatus Omnitrophota bacterium]
AGAQLPAVIVNVMRGGPGLGNIWPAQSDYFQATRGGGHGDYRSIVLAPSTVQESYVCMSLAFSLADQYRTPAIILSDGMLGQMMEPVLMRSQEHIVFSKVQPDKPWALGNCKGRSPNIAKSFYLREGDLEKVNLVLQKKYKAIEDKEQRYQGQYLDDARLILVAYGTMARIAKGAMQALRQEGEKVGLLRPISLWPFPKNILERLASSRKRSKFLVIEMSAGQMVEDVKLAVNGRSPVEFLGRTGGGMPSEQEITDKILKLL